MDDQTIAELRALRARAYGPHADLDADPAARERLRELEDLALARHAAEVEPAIAGRSAASDPVPTSDDTGPQPTGQDADADSAGAPAGSPARRWWTPRRVAVLWAASLVAVLVVSAAVSAAFTYRLQADPREEAVLSLDPLREVPDVYGSGPDSRVFEEFFGLVPLAIGYGNRPAGGSCLTIVAADTMEGGEPASTGLVFGGCGAGSFPATASFVVTRTEPPQLRDRFPDGTALQFVLDGSRVVVLSTPPQPDPADDAARRVHPLCAGATCFAKDSTLRRL